ncbi:hypothetical protein GCWU000324_01720 [Kingella oralis ATCC 51147]|uniref:Uncharacterized protein n=1 Tax=Kingella oralis ATCC 51147 TaxID=629741 RepID=C4GL63_9NEIS|nr:hypothetical protein GCWU000324_01720 [Kingella oralis ATCC 51147]
MSKANFSEAKTNATNMERRLATLFRLFRLPMVSPTAMNTY